MSVISRKKVVSQASGGGSSADGSRITNLENNEYKVTYYEIISGTSGSVTLPTGATINADEFGLSGNSILSKIDGSNKPTFESPKTSSGIVVTANLNESTGAWTTSGTFTDSSVALIYSIKIKALYYNNLTYSKIIDAETNASLPIAGGSMTGAINEIKGTDIASASTTNIGAATGNYIHITGTTTITAFDTVQAGTRRTLVFDGALTLTHNGTSLILPGAANITTAAGDTAIFISEGSGNWKCVSYMTASDSYTNWVPTVTGFSSGPTISSGNARYKLISRNTCHIIVYTDVVGTSNASTCTITLPFNASNNGVSGQTSSIVVMNSGSYGLGTFRTRLNSNIADIYNGGFGAFTASGNKGFFLDLVYEISL